jgi:hypothetical protein
LTDEVFAQLCTRGYAIVPRYFAEELRAAMAAAIRRLLKPWDQVRHDAPANRRDSSFIGGLGARDRELFRFPPAGHPYYTAQTLQALEEQYPGWNRSGEYTPA